MVNQHDERTEDMIVDSELHTRETVTTWADGYGVWHAKVSFPEPGYGDYLDSQIDRIRAKARRAIRRECIERGAGKAWVCRVHVVDVDQDSMNVNHSITYAETV